MYSQILAFLLNRHKHKMAAFFALCLMTAITATLSTQTDIACLNSIKSSLEDPFDYLKTSWEFSNYTEGFICRFIGVECWHPDENKVLNLRLSNMGLKGNFPVGIRNCTSLTGLDLSNNDLQGPIPSAIDTLLPYITTLDLSSNNFSGEIPSTLANCSYLNLLKLDHNRLTGRIPSLSHRIKMFNVADNLLSGPVPKFPKNTSVYMENNAGLCTTCSQDPMKSGHWRFDRSFKGGFVIGYVVFCVSTMVLYASYCMPWVYIGSRNQRMTTILAMVLHMLKKRKNKLLEFHQFAALSMLDFLLEKEASNSENFVTRMKYEDLLHATENFRAGNIVGCGETGTIYKASLPNGWSRAVKTFYISQNAEEQFITELKILRRLRHNNINPLIGFCKEPRKRILVYEYASNGKLFDWLHSTDGEKKNVLTWPIRMKIAVGLARGLAWLHRSCNFQVAHLNVSSKSVLLDEDFEPKLSNFGMATLVDPNEIHDVSSGFVMDMEFWEQCFVKEDVFNFGVVLIELITGENDVYSSINSKEDGIKGEAYNDEMAECVSIANECMHPFPEQRPTMVQVYAKISTFADTSAD